MRSKSEIVRVASRRQFGLFWVLLEIMFVKNSDDAKQVGRHSFDSKIPKQHKATVPGDFFSWPRDLVLQHVLAFHENVCIPLPTHSEGSFALCNFYIIFQSSENSTSSSTIPTDCTGAQK